MGSAGWGAGVYDRPVRLTDPSGTPRIASPRRRVRDIGTATRPGEVRASVVRGDRPPRPIDVRVPVSTRDLRPGGSRVARVVNVAEILAGRAVAAPVEPWRRREPIPARPKSGSTGHVREFDGPSSPPPGVISPPEFGCRTVTPGPGAAVIPDTDGVVEAFDARREMSGAARPEAAPERCPGAPDRVVDTVRAALFDHTGARTRAGDRTPALLRRTADGRRP